jgi:hypothetical protein
MASEASRKIDIVERKRQLAAEDPIPPEFGFGITIQVLKTYKPGRFSELAAAVERARTKLEAPVEVGDINRGTRLEKLSRKLKGD